MRNSLWNHGDIPTLCTVNSRHSASPGSAENLQRGQVFYVSGHRYINWRMMFCYEFRIPQASSLLHGIVDICIREKSVFKSEILYVLLAFNLCLPVCPSCHCEPLITSCFSHFKGPSTVKVAVTLRKIVLNNFEHPITKIVIIIMNNDCGKINLPLNNY